MTSMSKTNMLYFLYVLQSSIMGMYKIHFVHICEGSYQITYQVAIDNYNKYFAHSQVYGLTVQYNKKKTILEKIKDCLWN